MGTPGRVNVVKLAKAIEFSHIPKAELARRAGCSRLTIENILHGGDPYISNIAALGNALGVSVGFLLDEEPEESMAPDTTVSERFLSESSESRRFLTPEKERFYVKIISTLHERVRDKEQLIDIISERINDLEGQFDELQGQRE